MERNQITIWEGDRLWPLMAIIANTYIDDLSEDRIQQLVAMVDGWRITDAEGRPLDRAGKAA
jgi:hypothetical protein